MQVDGVLCPERVSRDRTKFQVLRQIDSIESEVSEAGKKVKRTLYGIKEAYNPLFSLSIDLYQ